MHSLIIYPTSRALRTVSSELKTHDGFLPTLMRMDEFEHRAVVIPNKMMIDPIQRIMFLREAADFQAFENLKVDRELIRFFSKSDALFKFFEELARESVAFDALAEADAYAEFDAHLTILETLLSRYQKIVEAHGLTDKALIPKSYRLSEGFIQGYDQIEIHLEGYLSHYELELIEKIAQKKTLIIHYATSQFNQKMQDRFEEYDMKLPQNAFVSFDFSARKIVSEEINCLKIYAKVLQVEERYEQISAAFMEIETLVRSGMDAESIVLILPDESFKESFALYDRFHNLNFAMGFDYEKGKAYKRLEALYVYWQTHDRESRFSLERYGVEIDEIDTIVSSQKCDPLSFFSMLEHLKLLDCPLGIAEESVWKQGSGNEQVFEKQRYFLKLFKEEQLSRKEWLFLWLEMLSQLSLDDIRAGKITVMGVLETRGVGFDAVVIVDFNEGIVPASSSKDQFLNSSVRTFAGLPTLRDRESLQKQYYKRLFEQAKQVVILYCNSENRLPSKFLYELGIDTVDRISPQLSILYDEKRQIVAVEDPIVKDFDASEIIWSATRLKTYLECKRKYHYRYIQKIKAKKEEELNEGSFLHLLLDHLYRENDHYNSIEEIKKSMDKLFDQLLPHTNAKIAYQKLLWKEKMNGFVEAELAHFEAGWRVVAREYEVEGEIGGLRFAGRIDRLDQDDTSTLVIDYKSGSIKDANKSKNLETLSDFQMSIYDQLLREKYQNITLAFMQILEGGKLEEITMLEEKNTLLAEHIIELKQTREFVASRCEELQKCKYCEFALMCERGEYL